MLVFATALVLLLGIPIALNGMVVATTFHVAPAPAGDGFELGNTGRWTLTVP